MSPFKNDYISSRGLGSLCVKAVPFSLLLKQRCGWAPVLGSREDTSMCDVLSCKNNIPSRKRAACDLFISWMFIRSGQWCHLSSSSLTLMEFNAASDWTFWEMQIYSIFNISCMDSKIQNEVQTSETADRPFSIFPRVLFKWHVHGSHQDHESMKRKKYTQVLLCLTLSAISYPANR